METPTIREVLVVGAGSAGLLAALALKRRLPALKVRVLASSKLGIIGVGEGTVPYVLRFVHQYLGFDEHDFYAAVDPVYKLGVRLAWGRRPYFDYTFSGRQWNRPGVDPTRPAGFYAGLDHRGVDLQSALMEQARALPPKANGLPDVPPPGAQVAWHLENHRFVEWLARTSRAIGIKFIDASIAGVERAADGSVEAIVIDNGARIRADLFVDASGFNSELLGKALEEPYDSYAGDLLCDAAVVGGWERREGEAILPYTVSDTMECGWSWRIDHPERIHRGYVFSSEHLEPEAAERELRAKNPAIGSTRLVRFRSGRHRRFWVKNVVAVGNSGAFVEPLEATAILCICLQSQWLADGLIDSRQQPTPSLIRLYNGLTGRVLDEIRDFLALHYRFNQRLDNPFWERCRREIRLGGLEELVDFYQENGPSGLGGVLLDKDSPFGLDGYLAILVGLEVKHRKPHAAPAAEAAQWRAGLAQLAATAAQGLPMEAVRKQLRSAETWKKLRSGK